MKIKIRKTALNVTFLLLIGLLFFSCSINKKVTKTNTIIKTTNDTIIAVIDNSKNVNFSDEFIKLHKGKPIIEVPEVHELANIMVAISKVGQLDSNMIDMTTEYHAKVLKHFLPYKEHAAIDSINNHIKSVMDMDSYWFYFTLKMNACGYNFDKNNTIIDDGIIHKMTDKLPDPFAVYKDIFEDFAKESGFRQFFNENKTYYDALIRDYKKINPIDKMQGWLEDKFPYKYGNYRITFSPLVGGAHSTERYEDNGFKQTVMFVCRAHTSDLYNENVNAMYESRVVFTEIDHNYVNPISDRFKIEIENAMENREKWVNESRSTAPYNTPYKVFNEYMTWSLFSLYCYDYYEEADVKEFISLMEKNMVEGRGFIKFDEFNQKLISQYKSNPGMKIDTLFSQILIWCKNNG